MELSTNEKLNLALNLSTLVQIEVKCQLHKLSLGDIREPLGLLPAVMLQAPPSIEEVITFSDNCRDPADVAISSLDPEGQRQAMRDSSAILSFIRTHEKRLAEDLRDAAIALEAEYGDLSVGIDAVNERESELLQIAALTIGTYYGRQAVLKEFNVSN